MDEYVERRRTRRYRDVGGTSGGIVQFLMGLVMAVSGGYLLLSNVTVTSHFWRFFGYDAFGISLIPLLFGVALLFYNGKNVLGWLLIIAGATIIFAGVLLNLQIFVRQISLFNLLLMLVLLVGGLGLVARSLRPG